MTKILKGRNETARQRTKRLAPILIPLWSRLFEHQEKASSCRLGKEPRKRRVSCSTCEVTVQFELDEAVARFVSDGKFSKCDVCPYIIATRGLLMGIMFAPNVELASLEREKKAVEDIRSALTHINRAIEPLARDRQDMKALSDLDPLFAAWKDVINAEQLLKSAVHVFSKEYEQHRSQSTIRWSSSGRPPRRELQGIAQSSVVAWQQLTGSLPAKNNVAFHEFLRAAATTVFGAFDPDPDWEWVTRSARAEIKRRKSPKKTAE